ncbi:MAG: hypothetical protein PHD37_11835 [Gallionellaceae bacterium]|nr:hypothetical protein [Gallionellaceae bacterium]
MDLPVLNTSEAADSVAKSGGGCDSHTCGSTGDQLGHLPEHIREKVHNHPCCSEQAHHYFARMHVAVAPACNIQCHYCNRKYDCSNESRPGVVSEVLTPEQAVKKVMAVAANIPQMTVLGIAYTAAHGTTRFSLSRYATEAEIDRVIQVIPEIIAQLRKMSPYWGENGNDRGPAEEPEKAFAPVYA